MKFKYYLLSTFCMLFFTVFSGNCIVEQESKPELVMSFLSHAKIGLGTEIQENQLSVMFSTDYNGKLTDRAIKRGNWKDITDRFELSEVTEDEEFLATAADISDLVKKGDSFYIAFRYNTPAQTRDKRYVRWRVRHFNIVSIANGDSTDLVKKEPLTLHFIGSKEEGRTVASKNQVIFRGNLKRAGASSSTEDWAISAQIAVP